MLDDYSFKLSPKAKRAKQSILSEEEKENTAIEYVVPVFRGRYVSFSLICGQEQG